MSDVNTPMALADLESILTWVDSFNLSRPTKKINRDFSDAVLLAEILSVHYPKLVEMHNYPPRNSHALKLNNWMTLNRKVLKRLRLNLCSNTMDHLANATPGFIERVLVMVRERVRRDEELNKSNKDAEQNMSSGGSYYEACGDDESVLVVPVKTRVNGVLEVIHQKVICHDAHLVVKEELNEAKECIAILKQKVDHLVEMLQLKDERIEELHKQLERKQVRRKEVEELQTAFVSSVDIDLPISSQASDSVLFLSHKSSNSSEKTLKVFKAEDSKIPIPKKPSTKDLDTAKSESQIDNVCGFENKYENVTKRVADDRIFDDNLETNGKVFEQKESKTSMYSAISHTKIEDADIQMSLNNTMTIKKISKTEVENQKLEVLKENEITERNSEGDNENFKDSEEFKPTKRIEDEIQKEIKEMTDQVKICNFTAEYVSY